MAAAVDSFKLLFDEISRGFQVYNEALALLGVYFVAQRTIRTVYRFQKNIRVHFLSRVGGNADLIHKLGEWAVVTGSTDGIGKAYAQELASLGVNIVLISRSSEKLHRVAKEIESKFHVKTHVIKADFSQGQEIYPKISKQLAGLEVGLLVNNVGAMDYPQFFLNMPIERIWQLININIGAATLMTKIILPQMVERRRGAIVNISAGAAIHPNPQLAVYSASKTYLDYFSQSIEYEYKDKGIIVQSLLPSYVATKMTDFGHKMPKTSFLIPSATIYARHALSTLGTSNRTTGYWPHTLQFWISSMTPEWLWLWGASVLNSALRRQAQVRKRHHSRNRMVSSGGPGVGPSKSSSLSQLGPSASAPSMDSSASHASGGVGPSKSISLSQLGGPSAQTSMDTTSPSSSSYSMYTATEGSMSQLVQSSSGLSTDALKESLTGSGLESAGEDGTTPALAHSSSETSVDTLQEGAM